MGKNAYLRFIEATTGQVVKAADEQKAHTFTETKTKEDSFSFAKSAKEEKEDSEKSDIERAKDDKK